MENKCKYCGFSGTNDEMEKHAGDMCFERLNKGAGTKETATEFIKKYPLMFTEDHDFWINEIKCLLDSQLEDSGETP